MWVDAEVRHLCGNDSLDECFATQPDIVAAHRRR